MYRDIECNMTDEQKEIFVKEYGSMEAFRNHFWIMRPAKRHRKNLAKVVEWYGDKRERKKCCHKSG